MFDNNKNNIFLIGMMGSWKSTIGSKIAKVLKMDFYDTDDVIEEVTDMKVADIFRDVGEERFRKMERAFFIEKTKQKNQLFSTGGGIVLDGENRKILKNGITFLLDTSPNVLASRISHTNKRPLLDGPENLENKLQTIWNEREKYYLESAQYIIQTDKLMPSEVTQLILGILNSKNDKN